ncbi:TetR/AcrR family transcriptional regulator [Blastococcus sp. URHD0036]|uniref:TetR/AcrR family transcriptional regulator n=1 Tax=Blastococcus sp. URHD0036 TaxID=1380356 RepID=UPI0018CC2B4C|nr:TetR/AcrR family transcriptional regulator [Blastococcus sp. URHD0036]
MTDSGVVRRGRGRPPSTHVQEAIRTAAARLFGAKSYDAVSVREVAAAAGVDPSLVIRHFGSKEALFLQTMTVDEAFRGLAEGPLEDLGRLILERLLTVRGGAAISTYAALIGAIDRPEVRSYLEASADRHVVAPLAERLTGPDRELRARLVATQVNGLLFDLRGRPDTGLAGRPTAEVLAVYARALQALIDDPTG